MLLVLSAGSGLQLSKNSSVELLNVVWSDIPIRTKGTLVLDEMPLGVSSIRGKGTQDTVSSARGWIRYFKFDVEYRARGVCHRELLQLVLRQSALRICTHKNPAQCRTENCADGHVVGHVCVETTTLHEPTCVGARVPPTHTDVSPHVPVPPIQSTQVTAVVTYGPNSLPPVADGEHRIRPGHLHHSIPHVPWQDKFCQIGIQHGSGAGGPPPPVCANTTKGAATSAANTSATRGDERFMVPPFEPTAEYPPRPT